MKRMVLIALLAATACSLAISAYAIQVLPVNLENLVEKAGIIFEGTCLSVDYRTDDQGLMATYTTFEVHQTWKGQAPHIFTIKTYGGQRDSLKAMVPGMPQFNPRQRVLLFLYPESASGFTSPVGMGQGRFTIFTTPDGQKKVVNDHNNRELFRDIDWSRLEGTVKGEVLQEFRVSQQPSAGPVKYEAFKHLIESLIHKSRP